MKIEDKCPFCKTNSHLSLVRKFYPMSFKLGWTIVCGCCNARGPINQKEVVLRTWEKSTQIITQIKSEGQ